MTKQDIIRKITSRKFIVSFITMVAGIITLFVNDTETVNVIASAAMIVIPTIVYCFMEGKVDAERVQVVTETVVETATQLGADEKVTNVIDSAGKVAEVLLTDDEGEEE